MMWLLWIILILILTLILIGYFFLLRYFFRFALDPGLKTDIGMVGKGTKYEPEVTIGYQWLHDHDKERYTTISFDGLTLHGHFFPAENAKRTILFFHGWRGGWDKDFAPFITWFHKNNCHLLLVEERAQGNSTGKYMGMGILERKDVLTWLSFYQKEKGPSLGSLPIYLMGVSMGASTVLMSAGEELPKQVKGIIADCGFSNPYEMFKNYGKRIFHIPEFPLLFHLNHLCKRKISFSLKDYSVEQAMETCELPILFIHGAADTFVLPSMTEKNYQRCHSKKSILVIDEAEHCMSFLVGKEAYTQALKQFFCENDTDFS